MRSAHETLLMSTETRLTMMTMAGVMLSTIDLLLVFGRMVGPYAYPLLRFSFSAVLWNLVVA